MAQHVSDLHWIRMISNSWYQSSCSTIQYAQKNYWKMEYCNCVCYFHIVLSSWNQTYSIYLLNIACQFLGVCNWKYILVIAINITIIDVNITIDIYQLINFLWTNINEFKWIWQRPYTFGVYSQSQKQKKRKDKKKQKKTNKRLLQMIFWIYWNTIPKFVWYFSSIGSICDCKFILGTRSSFSFNFNSSCDSASIPKVRNLSSLLLLQTCAN